MVSYKGSIPVKFRSLFFIVLIAIGSYLIVKSLTLAVTMSRPIPYWDQWEFIKIIPQIYAGKFSLYDLFAQHNEHRIATARLFFILDLLYFDASFYSCIVVLYVTLAIIAGTMAMLGGQSIAQRVLFFVLFTSFLYSKVQWENLASGFQIAFPFVDMFMIVSLACLIRALDAHRRRGRIFYLAAASILDFLGIFSMASGVLVIVPALWIGIALQPRSRIFHGYVLAHLFYCVIFFLGYVKLSGIAATYNPITLTHYSVVYLGACLRGYAQAPLLLGLIDTGLFVYALVLTFRRARRDRAGLDRVQVFAIAVALLLVSGAYLTAHGRASLGIPSATASRYSIQSILFQLSLFIFYWRALAVFHLSQRTVMVLKAASLIAVLSLSVLSNVSTQSLEEWQNRVSAYDVAGFGFANGVYSDDMLSLVYPIPDAIRTPVQFLASHRLGPFSVRFGQAFRPPQNVLPGIDLASTEGCLAQFAAKRIGPHWFKLEGWAFDAASPAGGGWIVVMDDADQERIVGFGRQSIERLDVDEATNTNVGQSGFDLGLNSPSLANDADRTFTAVLIPQDPGQPNCKASVTPTSDD